jgi:hypothetical protein
VAADAHDAYLSDRAAGKDALLICDTTEMADALNHCLHSALTVEGPAVHGGRDQEIRKGDIIISRRNDVTVDLQRGPGHQRDKHLSQVRNGDRWRVAGLDAVTGRIAAERLSDQARAVFGNDYVRQHIILVYAATVHSAQGATADTAHAVIGETASRAMAYVAMSRSRDDNRAYIYSRDPLPLSVFWRYAHAASPCGVWVLASPLLATPGRGLVEAPSAPAELTSVPWPVPTCLVGPGTEGAVVPTGPQLA